jgi:hypothetical protein
MKYGLQDGQSAIGLYALRVGFVNGDILVLVRIDDPTGYPGIKQSILDLSGIMNS